MAVKKPEQAPQDYSPKKPAIVKMAKNSIEIEKSNALLPSAMLENIVSPNEPWVGSCSYLLCLTSLFMYLERDTEDYYHDESMKADFNGNFGFGDEKNTELALLNRERIYKVFLTVTGMGLVNHWSNVWQTQNYEKAEGFLERSMRFCGYGFEIFDDITPASVMERVKLSICLNVPIMASYESGWELVIGYDETEGALILRKGEGTVQKKDYTKGLKSLLCVTETGLEKPDWRDIVKDIIDTMETDDAETGINGYYKVIDYLLDDSNFSDLSDEEAGPVANSIIWGYYVSHAEMRGFSGMGFEWRFLNRYNEVNEMADLFCQLSYYGDQHHQIAWCGDNIFKMYGGDIRNRVLREKLAIVVYYFIENDMLICRLLKQVIGLDTPDALIPKDRTTGEIYSTQIKVNEKITAEEILADIKVINCFTVDFDNDLKPYESAELTRKDDYIEITSHNDVWGQDGIAVAKKVNYPFRVDMRAKTDNMNIHLYYEEAYISFRQHPHCPDSFWIRDMLLGLYLGYDGGGIPVDEFVDIIWVVNREYMAVIVDGKVLHYGKNYPFMRILNNKTDEFRFGTAEGSKLTVEKIVISELE